MMICNWVLLKIEIFHSSPLSYDQIEGPNIIHKKLCSLKSIWINAIISASVQDKHIHILMEVIHCMKISRARQFPFSLNLIPD